MILKSLWSRAIEFYEQGATHTTESLNKPEMRIGIFGGSFDPPHLAHLKLLLELQKKFPLERIWIVPSKYPPGKTAVASFEKRLSWCKRLFQGEDEGFKVSDFEKSTTTTLFGKDIYSHISAVETENQKAISFYWILGEDQWTQLSFWKDIDSYGPQLGWIILAREKSENDKTEYGFLSRRLQTKTCSYRFAPIRNSLAEVSSTQIRKKLQSNTHSMENAEPEISWIPEQIREDVFKEYQTAHEHEH